MKVVLALIVVLTFCAVDAAIFTRKQSERLHLQSLICADRIKLEPYEIGNIVRAIRPTEKLIATGQCVLKSLNTYLDEVASDILHQIRVIVEGGIIPKVAAQMIKICEEAVGASYCKIAASLVQLILELGHGNGIAH